jgi:hypothetical protein
MRHGNIVNGHQMKKVLRRPRERIVFPCAAQRNKNVDSSFTGASGYQ